MSGHITLNAIGSISEANVVSWDYTITSLTNPAVTYLQDSSDSGATRAFIEGKVIATDHEIRLIRNFDFSNSTVNRSRIFLSTHKSQVHLAIIDYSDGTGGTLYDAQVNGSHSLWGTFATDNTIDHIIYASSDSSTAVPEPSSVALLGVGSILMTIGAYRRRGNQKQIQRGQDS